MTMHTDTEILTGLFKDKFSKEPVEVAKLPQSGSNRRYYRLKDLDGESVIGVVGTSAQENHAFLSMAHHFGQDVFLPVPRVYAVSEDSMAYLQEDLGDKSLFDAISHGRETGEFSDSEMRLLSDTIRELPRFQLLGAKYMDFSVCYPTESFDRQTVMWDLNYFKYCFLKVASVEFDESRLEEEFQSLTESLLRAQDGVIGIVKRSFMYRDFQSRNVMIDSEGKPRFIDFQGGRRGPVFYDVVSFLWQAKARFPRAVREELIETYLDSLSGILDVDRNAFKKQLPYFVIFRIMQVLGAYGLRGLVERKEHFIQSIPFAISNLRDCLEDKAYDEVITTYLRDIFTTLVQNPKFAPKPLKKDSPLTVTVMSFSYKKGIPQDESGNGGGYVFDCRGVHNPGKYDIYKPLTGLDKPVIDFLEKDGEILTFLSNCYAIVDAHVERFIERDFTSLMVCFGCTGGRHRSVYSAQKMAEHLHRKYGVRVHLIHRERGIDKTFEQGEQI